MPPFSNPKCFASAYANCSAKMSREHFVSEGCLKEMDTAFLTDGLAWQKPGERQTLSIKSLRSHILCKDHNSALNHLDDEGIKFFKAFKECKNFLNRQTAQAPYVYEIDGPKVVRWAFKSLTGILCSGNLIVGGKTHKELMVDKTHLDFIFNGTGLLPDGGLYFWAPKDLRTVESFQITALTEANKIYGVDIRLYGFTFYFCASKPKTQPSQKGELVFNPDELVFGVSGINRMIRFNWLNSNGKI